MAEHPIEQEEVTVFHDPRQAPFTLHGIYFDESENHYCRLPADVAKATSPGVAGLAANTAGGRIRFATDSPYLLLRVKCGKRGQMFHTTPQMQGGFDLYEERGTSSCFLGITGFDPISYEDYEFRFSLHPGKKDLTLLFPLYGTVIDVAIGLAEGATVLPHTPYTHDLPIVYYGSSITQGACASRPGTCYQAILSRDFDCDYLNMGFSGNAKGEEAIARYMADLPMCAFVSDYDHNAPSVEHLMATHYKLYETIRAKHPDIPYYMLTRPNYYFSADDDDRRAVVMESYLRALRGGDRNVWFIDGAAMYAGDDRRDCSLDNCHPDDLGFRRMATLIGDVFENTLFKK